MLSEVRLKQYAVSIPGWDGESIVNAETASKARYSAWIRINDVLPDVRLIDMRVKRVSSPHAANTDTT